MAVLGETVSVRTIIEKAIQARTLEQAEEVENLIEAEVGDRYQRPIGDRWNNFGVIAGGGGSYDHKIIENVTNMQDAVLERAAISEFGSYDKVPYVSPREAAENLLRDINGDEVVVEFYESDPPTRENRRITPVFRDRGCGMTADQIPSTIFALGSPHKENINWLQGAFGLGGETTYRNAEAVVLVTRRAPEFLRQQEDDRIAVAVVLWEEHGKGKGAYYLVTSPWNNPGDSADPFSVPANVFPEFEPGTHLALISYGVEGYHRARGGGDEKSFEAVLNTRIFEPLTPVQFSNKIIPGREQRRDNLKGLKKRLEDNPSQNRREGNDTLPFHIDGTTYHLPISFHVFSKRGEAGERRNFVAYDHALVFTSNGQTHYHWSPNSFRYKTKLNKLYDRIFVVVETDELPIKVRTDLFTADRAQLMRNHVAVQLEDAVCGFLNEWEELKNINSELIRKAIMSRGDSRSTINIARQISRALTMRGFSLGGRGRSSGGPNPPGGSARAIELFNDPTVLEGPAHVKAEDGKTKFITYTLNAIDDFLPRRGELSVKCSHPEIKEREITVGTLRGGRLRVSIAVPSEAETDIFEIEVSLIDWLKATGGIGEPLFCTTEFEIVPNGTLRRQGSGEQPGTGGGQEGNLVPLLWKSHEERDDWDKTTVGDVELVPAAYLAEAATEYAELSRLGDQDIPTLILNQHYYGLKRYLGARAPNLTDDGLRQARDRYAVGVGVGLCLLYKESEKGRLLGTPPPEEWLKASKEALARSTLSMMPAFDELAREAGIETE